MISPEVGAGWDPSRIESYASAESQERERRQQKAYEELCEMSTEGDGPASPAPAGLARPSLGSSICHISPKDLHPTKFHAWMHSAEAENLNRRQHERFIDSAINRDQKRRVRLHYEGTLIRIDGMPGWAEYENEKAPKRGKIKEFSAKSRSRMMALVASLKASSLPQFVTLTYPREWVHDPRMWKVHLDTFRKWLSRSYPSASGIWKLEPQERGAPHFHLLVFGIPFLPWQIVAVRWAEIVSQSKLPKSFPVERGKRGAAIFREWISNNIESHEIADHLSAGGQVKAIRSRNGVMRYCGKNYMGKDCVVPEGWEKVGRLWGVIGKAKLPRSEVLEVELSVEAFIRFRRTARRWFASKGFVRRSSGSLTLFTSAHLQWVRAMELAETGYAEGKDWTIPSGPGPAVSVELGLPSLEPGHGPSECLLH